MSQINDRTRPSAFHTNPLALNATSNHPLGGGRGVPMGVLRTYWLPRRPSVAGCHVQRRDCPRQRPLDTFAGLPESVRVGHTVEGRTGMFLLGAKRGRVTDRYKAMDARLRAQRIMAV